MSKLVPIVLVVACLAMPASAEPPPLSSEDDGFSEMFFSDVHVAECVSALDGLRQRALATVYDGVRAQLGADMPEVETSTGIYMVYSVATEGDTLFHSFSVSRAPYLATAFGKTLVGLASLRFGLPAPSEIRLSPLQVFHASWAIPREEHEALLRAGPPEWPDPISVVAAEALMRTTFVEVVRFDVDYEELQRLLDETSESSN